MKLSESLITMHLNWLLITDRSLNSGESTRKPKPESTRHGEPSQDDHLVKHTTSPHCLRLLRSPCLSTLQVDPGFVHHSDHVIDNPEISVAMGGFRAAEGE